MKRKHITNFQRTIATILLVSQILTSCVHNHEMPIPKRIESATPLATWPQHTVPLAMTCEETAKTTTTLRVAKERIATQVQRHTPIMRLPRWQKVALYGMALHNTFAQAHRPKKLTHEVANLHTFAQHYPSTNPPHSLSISSAGETAWMQLETDPYTDIHNSASTQERAIAPHDTRLHDRIQHKPAHTFHRMKAWSKSVQPKAALLEVDKDIHVDAIQEPEQEDGDADCVPIQERYAGTVIVPDFQSKYPMHIMHVIDIPAFGQIAFGFDTKALHILNMSDWTKPTPIGSYSIGELSDCKLSKDTKTAFLSSWSQGFLSLNISDLSKPTLLGNYLVDGLYAFRLSSDTKTAFLSSTQGFEILNISNLSNPTLLGNYSVKGLSDFELSSDTKTAFLSIWSQGFEILNISDLSNPTLFGNYSVDQLYNFKLSSDTKTAFLRSKEKGFEILNISDLSNPTLLGKYSVGELLDFKLSSDTKTAFLRSKEKGFEILNISDLSNPTLLGKYLVGGLLDFKLSSDTKTAFLRSYQDFEILNISDLSNPAQLGNYTVKGLSDFELSSDTKTAFLGSDQGFLILNISNFSTPFLMSYYLEKFDRIALSKDEKQALLLVTQETQILTLRNYEVSIQKYTPVAALNKINVVSQYSVEGLKDFKLSSDTKTAFLRSWIQGFFILNISDLKYPTLLSNYSVELLQDFKLSSDTKTAFLRSWSQGFFILNISDLSNPTLLGNYSVKDLSNFELSSDTKTAFLSSRTQDFDILNISDLSKPTLLGNYSVDKLVDFKLSSDTKTAFLRSWSQGFLILDISDLRYPALLGNYPIHELEAFELSSDTKTAFLSSWSQGFLILNISDLQNSTLLGNYPAHRLVNFKLSSDTKTAFLSSDQGFEILNISNLSNPTLLGDYSVKGLSDFKLSSDMKTAFLIVYSTGFEILDISNLKKPAQKGHYSAFMVSNFQLSSNEKTVFLPTSTGLAIVDIAKIGQRDNLVSSGIAGNRTLFVGCPSQLFVHPVLSSHKQLTALNAASYDYDLPQVMHKGIIMPNTPPWIQFIKWGKNINELNIMPTKEFSNKMLQVLFPVNYYANPNAKNESEKYYQVINFPVKPSLNITLNISQEGKYLQIHSPTSFVNVQISIMNDEIHSNDKIDFISEFFGSVRASFDTKRRIVYASGPLDNINTMLQELRYACKNSCKNQSVDPSNVTLQFVLEDTVNTQQILRGDKLTFLHLDMFQEIKKPLSNPNNTIEKQLNNNLIIFNQNFAFIIDEDTFISPDKDDLTYNAIEKLKSPLLEDLSFDKDSKTLSGIVKINFGQAILAMFMQAALWWNITLNWLALPSIIVCASNGYQEACSEPTTIRPEVSFAIIAAGLSKFGSIALGLFGIRKYRQTMHAVVMKSSYQYAHEEVVTAGKPYNKVIPLVKNAMEEAYAICLKLEKLQAGTGGHWFMHFVDQNGNLKKEALRTRVSHILQEEVQGKAAASKRPNLLPKATHLVNLIEGIIAKQSLNMPANTTAKQAYQELKATYAVHKKNWYANFVTMQNAPEKAVLAGNFPIQVSVNDEFTAALAKKTGITTAQKALLQANLLADVQGITQQPMSAYSLLSPTQGESIHLEPKDLKEITATVRKDTSHLCLRALRNNRMELPMCQILPGWLKYDIDQQNSILRLYGTPNLNDIELGEDEDGDDEKDKVTYYFTIKDKVDYIVKEFKLTVVRPTTTDAALEEEKSS